MQKTIIILFLFFLFSCNEFKEDSKGDFNQIVILSSEEDRVILEPIINDYIFFDTLYTPEPEPKYRKTWIQPDNFDYYKNYSNIFVVSITDPIDQTIDSIVSDFKNRNNIKTFPAITYNVYSKPQIITFIQNFNNVKLKENLDSIGYLLNQLVDAHVDTLYSYRYSRFDKNIEIEKLSSKIFNHKLFVDKNFKIIDYDIFNKFLWIGKGNINSSYEWLLINENLNVGVEGNLDLLKIIEQDLANIDSNIKIISNNNKYKKIESENINLYTIHTNYNHDSYKTGGPLIIYLLENLIDKKNIIFYGFVNAPGQNKLKYIKELETIIINSIF